MRMTTFKPTDNNPLKFSANVDDALHNLLVKRNAAYLGPVERSRMPSTTFAITRWRCSRACVWRSKRCSPSSTPIACRRSSIVSAEGALIPVPGKLRYWDLYREKFHDMVKDAEASFRELFGDEFASAYEEQLERLKARDRGER